MIMCALAWIAFGERSSLSVAEAGGDRKDGALMKIISASRRTDIPAFYSDWFMNRILSGQVKVMSPFSSHVWTVSLRPQDVLALAFWTKNASPLLPRLGELKDRGYSMFFLYTVNNYPVEWEPQTPDVRHTVKTLEMISSIFDNRVIRWRYDPVVITGDFDTKWNLKNFEGLCSLMKHFSGECIFSFCDYYRKTLKKMRSRKIDFHEPSRDQAFNMALEMADIGLKHGITLAACAHDHLIQSPIIKANCIDRDFVGALLNSNSSLEALNRLKRGRSRSECGCLESIDIGAYNTCYHDCVYCYATVLPRTERDIFTEAVSALECMDPRFNA